MVTITKKIHSQLTFNADFNSLRSKRLRYQMNVPLKFIFNIILIEFLFISKRIQYSIIIHHVSMGRVNSVTGLFTHSLTHSQEHSSVSFFPQLNCSLNSFLPFFFLLSYSVFLPRPPQEE